MAAPFSITPSVGADLNTITLAADIAAGKVTDARLGSQVFGSNGRLYVYVQANASIPASTAVCSVNTTTFLLTASAGSYLSPAVAASTGDRLWVSKASV